MRTRTMSQWLLVSASILSAAAWLSAPAWSASFDCAKASAWVERTVCSTPKLSKLDDELGQKYSQQLADAKQDKNALNNLKREQLDWLSFRRNTCTTVACIGREYQDILGKARSFYGTKPKNASASAFGEFHHNHKIWLYNPDKPNSEERHDAGDSIIIHRVPTKANLSIVDIETIGTNAHVCNLSDAKFTWAQNHWVYFEQLSYPDANPTTPNCELRLYPNSKGDRLLMVDRDNECRRNLCGLRAGLDGIVFHKKP